MAYPIVDLPVEDTVDGGVWHVRWRSKQAKPYNLPARYLDIRRQAGGTGNYSDVNAKSVISNGYTVPGALDTGSSVVQPVLAKARERFVSRVRDRAAWAVNLAEREQAVGMITNRAMQLFRVCRAIRKGRFGEVAGLLGTRDLTTARKASRSFSKNFLEWHFGWSPLLDDIHTSCEILSKPFRAHKAAGSASEKSSFLLGATSPEVWKDGGKQNWTVSARVAAYIRVTNPNLNLAAQMGLTNPATVLWELVPFSFVVDWFVNVSDFLGQFDEFIGLALDEPYHSFKATGSAQLEHFVWLHESTPPYSGYWSKTGSIDSSLSEFYRLRGLPSIELAINHGTILSVSRAVTAVALLIQKGFRA